jgi:arylformamidase
MHLVDLSHAIEHEMTTYPGLPGPQITDHLTFAASRAHYAEGTEFSIGRISLVANTGPYRRATTSPVSRSNGAQTSR